MVSSHLWHKSFFGCFFLVFNLLSHSEIECFILHYINLKIPRKVIFLVTFVAYENSIFLLFGANYGVRRFVFFWCFNGVSKHQRCVLRLWLIWWVFRIFGGLRIVVRRVVMCIVIVVKGRSGKLLIFAIVWWQKPVELSGSQG